MPRMVRGGLIQATLCEPVTSGVEKVKQAMIDKHVALLADAASKGVEVVCMQELFYGPYFCAEQDPKWYELTERMPDGPTTKLMQELATLGAKFEENLLDATQAWRLELHDEARLAGLPEDARERARQSARTRGLDGWALTLDFPCYHAVMCHATDRELRREMYEAWVTRASKRFSSPSSQ